ncbi:DoxX family protein [Williamsia sp. 1135]|uniref:DoxX family protein n=1 Tax=Williamsia sp. 1135 TaxID=1889262 RepID=UPI000A1134D7|nr:DoxX family protein [Williamsia sp. 1135]ORM26824.1 hypothetical protein BFL43_22320 [Williamsia sp. 1135]
MNATLWVMAIVLSLAFLVGGASQLVMSKEKYRSLGESQHWVDDFGAGHIKVIGVIKVIGALGLVLPAAVGLAPWVVPLAASGLMLVMAGAATTRFRRDEWQLMVGDVIFLSLFAFLAWGRFGLEPLT